MTSGRMRRVDEAVRQVIGDVVAGDLKDPRVGFVTVTDVRTSADLRHARVYVSVLGADGGASTVDEREASLAGLRKAKEQGWTPDPPDSANGSNGGPR